MARAASRPSRREPLEVWKFGGASLASAEQIEKAAALIAKHTGPLVVVPSALAGITDLLLEGARQALAGRRDEIARLSATFLRRHREVVRALLPRGAPRRKLLATVDIAAREYRELCAAIGLLDHLEPRASDRLVSRGERMSAQILTAALTRAGRRAVYVDALEVVETDEHHGAAAPNLAGHAPPRPQAAAAASRRGHNRRRSRIHRPRARRQRDDDGPGRHRPVGDAARPRA